MIYYTAKHGSKLFGLTTVLFAFISAGSNIPVVEHYTKKETKPNFLIFLTDDQRVNTLGCYTDELPIRTPNIDRMANKGIRFDNGFVTTPICVASRASILTGRYACNNRLWQFNTFFHEDVFDQTYPVILKKAGYFVGQLGKYGVGIRNEEKMIFDMFEGQSTQGPAFREHHGRMIHDSEWLTIKTREFLEKLPEGLPFCLQINYKAPHPSSVPAPEDAGVLSGYYFPLSPADTPEEFAKLPVFVQNGYGGRRMWMSDAYNASEDHHNTNLREYYEKIISVDRSVGHILQMLKELDVEENTVVIFLSDHGTHLGEKQLVGKWTPYEQSLRIPFIIYDPRPNSLKGVVRNEMVLNIDIAPTLLSMAGVDIPLVMDGMNMFPLINTDEHVRWRDLFYFEHYTSPSGVRRYIPRSIGVRSETGKYLRWIDPDPYVEELYDLVDDPLESENLINKKEQFNLLEKFRESLDQWREYHPSNYYHDSYGRRPQSGAKEIDWQIFQEVRPEVYLKIKAEIEYLGVTWQQAMDDWEIRFIICSNVGYWY